ncbi:MAG TPA: Gfo/Idh/MocA family oxidoreductase [Candidatus Paceibacterota bacterium]|nr:Gfo/Idh/MocA family oxidoreductase [Verrucomicrobiota bacterium]HRY49672.1 Gfo/Idh/MocA family oxidoreductase [Candidatus Paceibacterota bacterium]
MNAMTSYSRRQFLQRGCGWLAASVVLPQVLPSGVLGAGGGPGANERIGIGIIGMGRQAGDLLRILQGQATARLLAVADVNLNRARDVAGKRQAEAYQDYRRLLERKDVDAIITATPEQWRAIICIEACQAGKDIYAEKPMSLTIHEGRQIVKAVRKYGRVLQTGSQQRSMLHNHIGCEFIRRGGLGKVHRVVASNYPSPWECALPAEKVPDGLDWDMWCGPTEPVPYNKDLYLPRANPGWLSFRPYSGGEMTGWGSHGFDQVQWALGMDATGPLEIWVEGPKFDPPTYAVSEPKTRGDKICSQPKVFFRYPGGTVMELGDGPPGGAIFFGEKGKVTIDRGVCESEPDALIDEAIKQGPRSLKQNHIQNWLDCIKTRATPVADVEIGHRSATICHLGNLARRLGRKLRWDPGQEVFIGDKEANQYLDRKRRKPWALPRV